MKRKLTPKAMHRRVHTFKSALYLYYVGKMSLPYAQGYTLNNIKEHMAFTHSLMKAWARSPREEYIVSKLSAHE
jgi:hypothetical protein